MDVSQTATQVGADGSQDRVEQPRWPSGHAESRLERGILIPVIVLLAATLLYGSIYFREDSIPTAVGANLVPAERVLKGEVPYRDFYKIQTPGVILINAALFRLFGATLFTAMTGVLIFKVITVALVFSTCRRVTGWKTALFAAGLSLVWLAPGGPFRSAPVQYETPLLVAAVYFTLRWLHDRRAIEVFAAGVAAGLVAVLKQNVGVYAVVALTLSILLNTRGLPRSVSEASRSLADSIKSESRAHLFAMLGFAIPLAAMTVYLAVNGALGAAIKIFITGPGEHLQSRFTGYPLPKYAILVLGGGGAALVIARKLSEKYERLRTPVFVLLVAGAALCAAAVADSAVDNCVYWFAPSLFVFAFWRYFRGNRDRASEYAAGKRERGILIVLLLFSLAAYGEVFPRSVRGLVIDTMPAAFILLSFLLTRRSTEPRRADAAQAQRQSRGGPNELRLVSSALLVVLFVFAGRTVGPRYFRFDTTRGLRLRGNTELKFERGRRVYLPARRAQQISSLVELIQSRVEPGGYFFAHALDATSYYFLAARNSPTGATLWNDTGTSDAERARTMTALREKDVRIVLTSRRAMAAERYESLLDYLHGHFHQATAIGPTIVLERNH